MALVVFRSRAAAEIYMFAQTAQQLLNILGCAQTPQGVITPEDLPQAIERLTHAIDASRPQTQAQRVAEDAAQARGEPVSASDQTISLAQRAYPLLEMLRAALKRNVAVTWGL